VTPARACAAAAAVVAIVAANASATPAVRPAPTPKTGAAPWPAPPDALRHTRMAGLTPERHEFLQYHVHALLLIYLNGRPVRVPAGIGINIHDAGVHSSKLQDGTLGYGGIDECAQPCISPLHTHDDFTEWGVALSKRCIGGYCTPKSPLAFYVDGKPYTDDPRAITLTDRKVILIVIGTPPKKI
jgi:hypothetical protein